ncbi:Glucose-methanol-choline oxidoreductase [Sergentomyia squamirostris]
MLGLSLYCGKIIWKIGCYVLFTFLLLWNYFNLTELNPLIIDEEYDYIIVGTGVGGSVVASGIQSNNVLILEAGTRVPSLLYIPMAAPLLFRSPYDWNFYTTPQKHGAKAFKNRQIPVFQGKTFGGSHMLNNMMYVRGHPDDYRSYIDGEYNFQRDIEEFFRRFESQLEPEELKYRTKLSDVFREAGQESGYGNFTIPFVTQKHGMRFTTANYYEELNRKGHRVIFGSLVTQVIFQEGTTVASGVKFVKNDKEYLVRARKGVILSAGTVGSAKILLQSGIGPRDHLEEMGIPLKLNLPVGDNLQDHVTTGYNILLLNESLPVGLSSFLSPKTLFSFLREDTGPLTMPGCESTAFLPSGSSDIPSLQFMILPAGLTSDLGSHLRKVVNLDDASWEKYFGRMLEKSSATVLPIVLHPKSRGTVRLRDSNPTTPPLIDPKLLSHPDDKEIIFRGIRILQQLTETDAMKRLGAEINTLPFPGCESHPWDSRDYWMCYIEHLTLSVFHPAGTCSMGSVVGKDFRVFHTEKLYIVDASVIPELPSGNPMATVGMLAHRFLDSHHKVQNL